MTIKKKSGVYADLNFVSPHSLESIVDELQRLDYENVHAQVLPTDNDTYVFQLAYQEAEHTTAYVNGRLRRWADAMTHIHCDGTAKSGLLPNRITSDDVLLAGIVICGVIVIAFLIALLAPQLLAEFMFVVFILGLFLAVSMISKSEEYTAPKKTILKPEIKHRDHLLDIITDIIADDNTPPRLSQAAKEKPLNDEEIALLAQSVSNSRQSQS